MHLEGVIAILTFHGGLPTSYFFYFITQNEVLKMASLVQRTHSFNKRKLQPVSSGWPDIWDSFLLLYPIFVLFFVSYLGCLTHKHTLTHRLSEVIASVFLDETKGRRCLCNRLDFYQKRDAYSICCLNPLPLSVPLPQPSATSLLSPLLPCSSQNPPLMCWAEC